MRQGLAILAVLSMAVCISATLQAAEGDTVKAQAHEYGCVLVRPAGSAEEVQAAQQEYQVHGNAMSMAINQKGVVRANVAVKEGGRVMLRNAGHVPSTSVVLGSRFTNPVQMEKAQPETQLAAH